MRHEKILKLSKILEYLSHGNFICPDALNRLIRFQKEASGYSFNFG